MGFHYSRLAKIVIFTISLIALFASSVRAQEKPPTNCHVTLPSDGQFDPPSAAVSGSAGSYVKKKNEFLFGRKKLWTVVPVDGIWKKSSLRKEQYGYSNDFSWFSIDPGFSKDQGLKVSARILNANNPPNVASGARWVFFPSIETTAINSHIPLLTLGCWKITGQYMEEKLSFTVWIN